MIEFEIALVEFWLEYSVKNAVERSVVAVVVVVVAAVVVEQCQTVVIVDHHPVGDDTF